VSHIGADAPPFLILAAESDFPGFLPDAKGFTDTLTKAGHKQVEHWIVSDRNHFTAMELGDSDNEARHLLLEFMKVPSLPPDLAILADAKRRWRDLWARSFHS
jgi:hypothetical protein